MQVNCAVLDRLETYYLVKSRKAVLNRRKPVPLKAGDDRGWVKWLCHSEKHLKRKSAGRKWNTVLCLTSMKEADGLERLLTNDWSWNQWICGLISRLCMLPLLPLWKPRWKKSEGGWQSTNGEVAKEGSSALWSNDKLMKYVWLSIM